jgi:lysozyme
MKLNESGKSLIKSFEGCRLTSYKCSANHDTIGYGNTFYEDGTKVKPGDKITQERANELFEIIAKDFADKVKPLIKKDLTENNFSAIVSFAYNVGVGNLKSSTLLKKVNINPSDETIRAEFMKWVRAGGKELTGLKRRRKAEADLYFKA